MTSFVVTQMLLIYIIENGITRDIGQIKCFLRQARICALYWAGAENEFFLSAINDTQDNGSVISLARAGDMG